jgi:cyclic pyranopterin phosphate synthase
MQDGEHNPEPRRPRALRDAFGRQIDYLRLSVTDRCQFRCAYCMPLEGVSKLRHEDMLSFEELFEVVRLMVMRFGFRKLRVTGGEPLARRGALGFMRSLHLIPGIEDLAFTTNAYDLAPVAASLRASGFSRVNISLDTLRRDRFRTITSVDGLERVLQAIEAARAAGFPAIKINAVALEETLDEVCDLVAFGIARSIQVRFIELMPVLGGTDLHFVPNSRVRALVETRYRLVPVGADGNPRAADPHGAAEVYHIDGTEATCGFISPMTEPFCRLCNRMRLRGDGRLKPCLAGGPSVSVAEYVRPQFRPDEMEAFLRESIPRLKREKRGDYEIDSMCRFGG